ncbi:plasmid partitioning protein RepB C-terminal domain-containing protein [Pseudogemmobacter bohemicus]|uniref:plasmid partitioning protein RepB C-terminal domain-containing protein n=1 Tax=Pseudogemmobacter bohemicus TaxID=2250708 RepID=UPI000DD43EE5|nr:ParB N-terminal domain-containing protein [Pseudogemmobacter bohemicus]
MVAPHGPAPIQRIPVDRIVVGNPRERNCIAFKELVDSIAKVGLKRPITVSGGTDGEPYQLVCGQGRLEAFMALGQKTIPAVIRDYTVEERLFHSIIENVARRQHRPMELLHDIGAMRKRGYSCEMIADKTGLTHGYVKQVCQLLEAGEARLLISVEAGKIPLNIAIIISRAEGAALQLALAAAYESGQIKGNQLLAARRLVEQRRLRGKGNHPDPRKKTTVDISPKMLVNTINNEITRHRDIVRKAERTSRDLSFLVAALDALLKDEDFFTLLRAEGLETMPAPIADLIVERRQ